MNDRSVVTDIDPNYPYPTLEEVDSWDLDTAMEFLNSRDIDYSFCESLEEIIMLIKKKLLEVQLNELGIVNDEEMIVDSQSLVKELLDKNTQMKNELVAIYKCLMKFLESEKIQGSAIEEVLSQVYLNYKDNLVSRCNELLNEKCPIVVAGETSAGKSSFLNLLLGPDSELLPHSLLCATSTICRLHNSQEKKFIYFENEQQASRPETLDGAATCEDLQAKLAPFVSSRERSKEKHSYVDIFWPIPMIQDPIIIVDTPGIGESKEMTDKLLGYLPNAVAFIYIISSDNAGGIQEDRLLQILRELKRLDSEGKSIFDPKCAIFVCNKWDLVVKSGEEEKVWKDTLTKLQKGWPGVEESQVFKMSTTNALRLRTRLGITKDFKELLLGLKKLVPLTLEARIKQHYKWMNRFISKLESNVASHISHARATQEERKKLRHAVLGRVNKLRIHSNEVRKKLHSEAQERCKELADNLFQHINEEDVRNRLFTWDVTDAPTLGSFDMEVLRYKAELKIMDRFQAILNEWEERNNNMKTLSDSLTRRFCEECNVLDEECQQINLMMEKPSYSPRYVAEVENPEAQEKNHIFGRKEAFTLIITAPVWIPLAIVASVIFMPIGIGMMIRDNNRVARERKDYEANKPMKMQEWAKEFLEKKLTKDKIDAFINDVYLKEYEKKIKTVCEEHIPRQIAADENTVNAIANELRSSTEIFKQYCPIQKEIQGIKGHLLLFDLKYFACDLVPAENVTEIGRISSGSFADVLKVNWRKTKNDIVIAALKCPRNKPGNHEIFEQLTEVQCLRACQCQHIVKLYGVLYDSRVTNGTVQLLLELCDETLESYIFGHPDRICGMHKDLPGRMEAFRIYVAMMTGICDGLAYIHHQGYLHRDLKMSNVLIQNGIPKICDVGLAKMVELTTGTFAGTITHMAPEVMLGKLYTFSADVYSLGIILWETWYGREAYKTDEFKDVSPIYLLQYIKDGQRHTFKKFKPWPRLESLISKCWHQDDSLRPEVLDIKNEILEIEADVNIIT
ncbi:hypothetical protein CHS0354_024193 [Potamilus streckersoni]|uniref:Protein kinase domain-containing protein n=1 Tax=Potamilus streckersoni TaxID=2493646 RepID=A0AAE0VPC2_9BIVA|nr:hypothetical protein CHS0354_024193 [Potamilus streckersoni]